MLGNAMFDSKNPLSDLLFVPPPSGTDCSRTTRVSWSPARQSASWCEAAAASRPPRAGSAVQRRRPLGAARLGVAA